MKQTIGYLDLNQMPKGIEFKDVEDCFKKLKLKCFGYRNKSLNILLLYKGK